MSTGMPKKNAAYTMYVSLVDQADTKLFKAAPTIAAGDFKVSKDGGALTNLATLPTVTPAASRLVKISLSATEMNADDVVVMCVDAAGAEWADLMIHLKPETRVLSDLAYPTVSGRSVDVTAGGTVGIDWANVEAPTTTVGLSGTTVGVTTTNSDMRGTDNAALASVVGALTDAAAAGDPTSADTLMQYAKQLVNTLEGTAGIPVFPASADPANNVSLAESIRAIRDDVTGLAGAAMRGTDGVDTSPMRGTDGANTTTPLSAAQVNAEVDTALADINLDHMVGTATGIPAVPAGTFLDQIMDDGTTSYDRTLHSLQAIIDHGDGSWTTGAGGSSADQPPAQEFVRQKASTNQTVDVYIASDSASGGKTGLVFNSAGASCYYRRGPTGTATQLVLATQTVGGAHTDGGFVEIDSTNMPGHYRLDLSDAIVATGVDFVDLVLNFTGAMAMPIHIVLTADDVTAAGPIPPTTAEINAAIEAGQVGIDTAAIITDTADMQPKIGTPAVDMSADIAAVKGDTAAILVDTVEIGVAGAGLTNINLPDQTMNITGNLSGSVGSVTGAVGSVAGHTPQTGDSYARLGAPAGVSVSADNAAIKADTAEIGTAGAGLTDLGGCPPP